MPSNVFSPVTPLQKEYKKQYNKKMNLIGLAFNTVFVDPIINLLSAIYHFLVFLHIPSPLGFSIITLTILIRFVLYPLTASQLRTSKKMQELAPKLNKLKEVHKADAKKLQAETMKLYKEHGVNPAAGCVPLLLQLPIIWGLYGVLRNVVNPNAKEVLSYVNHAAYTSALHISSAWDTHFFGLPLGGTPASLVKTMPLIILVPVITAVLQFIQSKMMVPAQEAEEKVKEVAEKKKDTEDFTKAFQTQSLYIFPLMIGFFSWSFPVGLSFYWNTFTLFGILQQYKIAGWGGLADWKNTYAKKIGLGK